MSKSIPIDHFYDLINLSITKNIEFDVKTNDHISNPDHSTRWHGWEFDLLIFDLLIFQSLKMIDHDRIDLLIYRSQKTIDSIEKLMMEFPTLHKLPCLVYKRIPPFPLTYNTNGLL